MKKIPFVLALALLISACEPVEVKPTPKEARRKPNGNV